MNIVTTSNPSIRGNTWVRISLSFSRERKCAEPAISWNHKWSLSQKALRLQTYGFPLTSRGPKIRLLLVNKADYLSKGDFRSRSELMAGTRTRTRREIKWISNGDCNPGNATRESKNPFAPWIDPLSRELTFLTRESNETARTRETFCFLEQTISNMSTYIFL